MAQTKDDLFRRDVRSLQAYVNSIDSDISDLSKQYPDNAQALAERWNRIKNKYNSFSYGLYNKAFKDSLPPDKIQQQNPDSTVTESVTPVTPVTPEPDKKYLSDYFIQPDQQQQLPQQTAQPGATFVQQKPYASPYGEIKAQEQDLSVGSALKSGLGDAAGIISSVARFNEFYTDQLLSGALPKEKVGKSASERYSELSQTMRNNSGLDMQKLDEMAWYDPQKFALTAVNMLPQLGLFAGSFALNPVLGYGVMVAAEGGETIQRMDEWEKTTGQKVAPGYKVLAPILTGAVNGVLEKYGINKILKGFEIPASVKQKIANVAVAFLVEGGTEGLQSVMQSLSQAGYTKEINAVKDYLESAKDQIKQDWPQILQEAYAGAAGGGGLAAVGALGSAGYQKYLDNKEQKGAEDEGTRLADYITSRGPKGPGFVDSMTPFERPGTKESNMQRINRAINERGAAERLSKYIESVQKKRSEKKTKGTTIPPEQINLFPPEDKKTAKMEELPQAPQQDKEITPTSDTQPQNADRAAQGKLEPFKSEFKKMVGSKNPTGEAVKYGLKNKDNADQLKELGDIASEEYKALRNEMETTTDEARKEEIVNTIQKKSLETQLYREAYEAATNTGSIAQGFKSGIFDQELKDAGLNPDDFKVKKQEPASEPEQPKDVEAPVNAEVQKPKTEIEGNPELNIGTEQDILNSTNSELQKIKTKLDNWIKKFSPVLGKDAPNIADSIKRLDLVNSEIEKRKVTSVTEKVTDATEPKSGLEFMPEHEFNVLSTDDKVKLAGIDTKIINHPDFKTLKNKIDNKYKKSTGDPVYSTDPFLYLLYGDDKEIINLSRKIAESIGLSRIQGNFNRDYFEVPYKTYLKSIKQKTEQPAESIDDNIKGYAESQKDAIISKLRAENAKNLSDTEIERVFKDSVGENKLVPGAKYLRDAGILKESDIKTKSSETGRPVMINEGFKGSEPSEIQYIGNPEIFDMNEKAEGRINKAFKRVGNYVLKSGTPYIGYTSYGGARFEPLNKSFTPYGNIFTVIWQEKGQIFYQKAKTGKQIQNDVEPEKVTQTPDNIIEWAKNLDNFINDGTATKQDIVNFVDAYFSPGTQEKLIEHYNQYSKQQLHDKFGGYRTFSTTKKESLVDSAVRTTVLKALPFDYFQQQWGDSFEVAVRKMVDKITPETIQKYAEEKRKESKEYEDRKEALKKALENPETLEEYKAFIRYMGRDKLSPEQKAEYDRLVSEETIRVEDERKTKRVEKISESGVSMELVKSFHTKKEKDIWVVKLNDRVERDVYQELNQKAKQLGGYYSSYRGQGAIPGFIFDREEAAKDFMALKDDDVIREPEKPGSQVDKLREMADNIEKKGTEKLEADRQTNTARRARMAEGQEYDARKQISYARTLRNIADAIERGETLILAGLTQQTQLDELLEELRSAKYDYLRNNPDPNKPGPINFDQPTTVEMIEDVKFPVLRLDANILSSVANEFKGKRGKKQLAISLTKNAYKAGAVFAPFKSNWKLAEKVAAALKEQKSYTGWQFVSYVDKINRFERMGIVNSGTLRQALRELIELNYGPIEADPIKTAERKLVTEMGKIEGWFPTPQSLIEEIDNVMQISDEHLPGDKIRVMDPSAGKGDLLDFLKGKYPEAEITAFEILSKPIDVMRAKGYAVEQRDFLEVTPQQDYDIVFMNPPFENKAYIDHVEHAWKFVKPGGILVAIIPNSYKNSGKREEAFRDFLNEYSKQDMENPENAFAGTDAFRKTNVRTSTFKLRKPKDVISEAHYTMKTLENGQNVPHNLDLSEANIEAMIAKFGGNMNARALVGYDFLNNNLHPIEPGKPYPIPANHLIPVDLPAMDSSSSMEQLFKIYPMPLPAASKNYIEARYEDYFKEMIEIWDDDKMNKLSTEKMEVLDLAKKLMTSGRDLEQIFENVRDDVKNRQKEISKRNIEAMKNAEREQKQEEQRKKDPYAPVKFEDVPGDALNVNVKSPNTIVIDHKKIGKGKLSEPSVLSNIVQLKAPKIDILEYVAVIGGKAYTTDLETTLVQKVEGKEDFLYKYVNKNLVKAHNTTLTALEFPAVHKIPGNKVATFAIDFPYNQIQRALKTMSSDNFRPSLQGFFMELSGTELRMTATDGHRLFTESTTIKGEAQGEFVFILPAKTVKLLSKDKAAQKLTITLHEADISEELKKKQFNYDKISHIHIKTDSGLEIIARNVKEPYPDYMRVIPTEMDAEFHFDRDAMLSALEELKPYIGKSQLVEIIPGNNSIILYVQEIDPPDNKAGLAGSWKIEIPATIINQKVDAIRENSTLLMPIRTDDGGSGLAVSGFNLLYLSDLLKGINSNTVNMQDGGLNDRNPRLFTGVPEDAAGKSKRNKGGKYHSYGDYNINSPGIWDMPEIVELLNAIQRGGFVKIKEFVRDSARLHGGFAIPGKGIVLNKDIFKTPELAKRILSHEVGHIIDFLGVDGNTMGRGNILGRMAVLKKYMAHLVEEYPGSPNKVLTEADKKRLREDAAKILREKFSQGDEEIIEEIVRTERIIKELNFTAEDIKRIWNDVNSRENNPELYEFISGLTAQEKKQILIQAMKGVGKTIKTETTETIREKVKVKKSPIEPTPEAILEKYKELLREEIIKRRLFQLENIMDELKRLTQLWKPFNVNKDPLYTDYRYSSPELYADAMSVLFNDPEMLKTVAPEFYRGFFNYLERKPDFKKIYDEINTRIKNPNMKYAARDANIDDMYREGEEIRRNAIKEDRKKTFSFLYKLKKGLGDKNINTIEKVNKLKKDKDYDPASDPAFALEELSHVDGPVYQYLRDISNAFDKKMEALGIDEIDIGKVMFLMRVLGDRAELANPLGYQPMDAIEQLDYLRSKLSKEEYEWTEKAMKDLYSENGKKVPKDKYDAILDLIDDFRAIRDKQLIPVLEAANMYSPELMEKIRDDRTYATFSVQHYLMKKHGVVATGKIYHQIGTFSEVFNPFTATIMKDVSLMKAAFRKKAIDYHLKNFAHKYPDEFIEAKRNPKTLEWAKAPKDMDTIIFLDRGKSRAFYVPQDIADSINNPYEVHAIYNMWQRLSAPIKNLFVGHFPPWAIFNFYRDTKALAQKTEVNSWVKAIYYSLKSFPDAVRDVFLNQSTPIVRQLYDSGVLIVGRNYAKKAHQDTNTLLDDIFEQWNLRSNEYDNIWKKTIKRAWNFLAEVGQTTERMVKIGGAKYFEAQNKGKPLTAQQIHDLRAKVGSPDFYRKGSAFYVYNGLFLFANAGKEGIRSSYEAYRDQPSLFSRNFRSSFWWKTMKLDIAPKLMMYAVQAGWMLPVLSMLFGDDGDEWAQEYEDMMRKIPDHDKQNYICVPLYTDENGETVYYLQPHDFTGQVIAGLFWRMLSDDDDTADKFANMFDYTMGGMPYSNFHPYITTSIAFGQFISTGNYYDSWRGQMGLYDHVAKEGLSARSATEFGKYAWTTLGGRNIYRIPLKSYSTNLSPTKQTLQAPFLELFANRIVRVSDRGEYETLAKSARQEEKKMYKEANDMREALQDHIDKIDSPGMADAFELYKKLKNKNYTVGRFGDFKRKYMLYAIAQFTNNDPLVRALANNTSVRVQNEILKKYFKTDNVDNIFRARVLAKIKMDVMLDKTKTAGAQ